MYGLPTSILSCAPSSYKRQKEKTMYTSNIKTMAQLRTLLKERITPTVPRVLLVRPEEIPKYTGYTVDWKRPAKAYARYQRNYKRRNAKETDIRKVSNEYAKAHGYYQQAAKLYKKLGWPLPTTTDSEIQLHHLPPMSSRPDTWVFAPRCLHMYAFHGRNCRNSHPLHRRTRKRTTQRMKDPNPKRFRGK